MAGSLKLRASYACSSRTSAFTGANTRFNAQGGHKFVMLKQGIHPEWFDEAKVFCNGEEVMTVSGTMREYVVDIYSGNHPFYQGVKSTVVMDEGQVNKFKKRFEGLDSLGDVSNIKTNTGAYSKDDDLNFDRKLITANKPKKKK